MFDLDKAINDWCSKVVAHNIWEAEKVDELKDHLYCIIEEQIAARESPEQAFFNATNGMGYTEATQFENSGRARIVSGICKVLSKIEGHPSSDSPMVIAHALIWACVMLAMAIVIDDKDTNSSVLMILTLGWFASYMALDGSKRSTKQEWACLKRRIREKLS
jgi:hypothetical protein